MTWRRKRKDEELKAEIQNHLDEAIRDRIARGEAPDEARANASRDFGNVGLVKEVTREMWGWAALERLWQDLRFGMRMLWKNKGFTAVAVLSLTLGIGANTAIFSLMDAALLRWLPVAQPEQLYFINNVGPRGGGNAPPYPCFERFRDQSQSFAGMAAFSRRDLRISIDEQREEVQGQFVSGNYFAVLGVNPLLGRALSLADDSVPGKGGADGYVAVISYNYWTRRFGRSPEAIGKVVRIGNDPVTIIGVTPPEFYGLFPGVEIDISLPLAFEGIRSLSAKQSW